MGLQTARKICPFFELETLKSLILFISAVLSICIEFYLLLTQRQKNKVVRIPNVRTHGLLGSQKRNRIIRLYVRGNTFFAWRQLVGYVFFALFIKFLYLTRTKSKILSIKKNNFSLMVAKFLV